MRAPRKDRYRMIRFGVETLAQAAELPRHRHDAGYATVVLAGSFEEASFSGRWVAVPGDVLLHGDFDCHANRALTRRPLQILRLPWKDNQIEGRFRVRDPDELAMLAECDPFLASRVLRDRLQAVNPGELHWTDQLASSLAREPSLCLSDWAEREGLAPATLSRGFSEAFGTSPKLFRLEMRARRAWNALMSSEATLTTIAHDLEFADLAHMSRSVSALTGHAPSEWRAARRQPASTAPCR